MQATDVELRHRELIRHLLFGASLATYFVDPDDVVWRFIKTSPSRRPLEHASFLVAAMLMCAGAAICTHAVAAMPSQSPPVTLRSDRSRPYPSKQVGELLYALGLATLFPLAGAILLVVGESLRILLLRLRQTAAERQLAYLQPVQSGPAEDASSPAVPQWLAAYRRESAKWGLCFTMLVFSITLIDRLAEMLAGASVLVWALLNLPHRQSKAARKTYRPSC